MLKYNRKLIRVFLQQSYDEMTVDDVTFDMLISLEFGLLYRPNNTYN